MSERIEQRISEELRQNAAQHLVDAHDGLHLYAQVKVQARRKHRQRVTAFVAVVVLIVAVFGVRAADAGISGGCVQTSGWPNAGCTIPTPYGTALAQLITNFGTQQIQTAWASNWGFACSGAIAWYPQQNTLDSYVSGTAEYDVCHHNPTNIYGISEARTAIVVPDFKLILYLTVYTSKWGIQDTEFASSGGVHHCGLNGGILWCN